MQNDAWNVSTYRSETKDKHEKNIQESTELNNPRCLEERLTTWEVYLQIQEYISSQECQSSYLYHMNNAILMYNVFLNILKIFL